MDATYDLEFSLALKDIIRAINEIWVRSVH